jgi:hypothetical protein
MGGGAPRAGPSRRPVLLLLTLLVLGGLAAGLWTVRSSNGAQSAAGTWHVRDDGAGSAVVENHTLTLVPAPAIDWAQARSATAVLDSVELGNYSFSLRLSMRRLPDNATQPVVKLLVRYSPPAGGYYVAHSAAGLELGKFDGSRQFVLARSATPALTVDETRVYRVDADGTTLRVFLDGRLWISYDDPQAFQSGQAGISLQGAQAVVTDAVVTAVQPWSAATNGGSGVSQLSLARMGIGGRVSAPLPTLMAVALPTAGVSPGAVSGVVQPNNMPRGQTLSGGTVGWGDNGGEIGGAASAAHLAPESVEGLDNATDVATGGRHSLAVQLGSVWTWGTNNSGQLGDGTTQDRTSPVRVEHLDAVSHVAAGDDFSLAVGAGGTVWTWGANGAGQLGDGTTQERMTPAAVPGLDNVSRIAAGHAFSLALKSDGTVWAWGANEAGELGDGTNISSLDPVQVRNLDGIEAVAAGKYFGLALRTDGTVWAWGADEYGQLGQGGPSSGRNAPVPIANLRNIKAIGAGGYHALALDTQGAVSTWGANWYGQLGSTTNEVCAFDGRSHPCSSEPRRVPGLDRALANVAAGEFHSLALATDGSVWAWGLNAQGELGDGTGTNSPRPVQVIGLGPQSTISAGGQHSLSTSAAWSEPVTPANDVASR